MSDLETQVYSFVSKYAKSKASGLSCASIAPSKEPDFPFALIQQVGGYDMASTLTSNHENEAERVTFEVDVYSAATKAPKLEAKKISGHISDAFKALGFVQTAGGQPIDLTDEKSRSIVRYFSRFEGVAHNGVIHTI